MERGYGEPCLAENHSPLNGGLPKLRPLQGVGHIFEN